MQDSASDQSSEEPQTRRGKEKTDQQTVKVMLKLMQGMQELQKQIVVSKDEGKGEEIETLRFAAELPKLQEWNPETVPIDFADWLVCLHVRFGLHQRRVVGSDIAHSKDMVCQAPQAHTNSKAHQFPGDHAGAEVEKVVSVGEACIFIAHGRLPQGGSGFQQVGDNAGNFGESNATIPTWRTE